MKLETNLIDLCIPERTAAELKGRIEAITCECTAYINRQEDERRRGIKTLLEKYDTPEARQTFFSAVLEGLTIGSKNYTTVQNILDGGERTNFKKRQYEKFLSERMTPFERRSFMNWNGRYFDKNLRTYEAVRREECIRLYLDLNPVGKSVLRVRDAYFQAICDAFFLKLQTKHFTKRRANLIDELEYYLERFSSNTKKASNILNFLGLRADMKKNLIELILTSMKRILGLNVTAEEFMKFARVHNRKEMDLFYQTASYLNRQVNEISMDEIIDHIRDNPTDHYDETLSYILSEREALFEFESSIPASLPAFFPKARSMHRHFYIHAGPTNSGKTYESIKRLKEAGNGVYLGPLRLLAFEVCETLREEGIPASLITGEETDIDPSAQIICSTTEKADLGKKVDVCVIDECQMIQDIERGGAWSRAIMGMQAYEIHLCAAPQAVEILKKLIIECADTYTVIEHERMTPIEGSIGSVKFPKGVEDGDALIVFSRKNVHAVASELQRAGKKVSVIYGALPYTVRQNEARRFRSGETKILVTTDAIGMGLNLPIKRIVFMELKKFDGEGVRSLYPEEIRQIAGRAGRRGLYEEGRYTSIYKRENKELIQKYNTPPDVIDQAVVDFPEEALKLDARVSRCLSYWSQLKTADGFIKQDTSDRIYLAKKAEKLLTDKESILKLIKMTFDTRNFTLLNLWEQFLTSVKKGVLLSVPEQYAKIDSIHSLDQLERMYKVLELYYQYYDRFSTPEDANRVMQMRQHVSNRMVKLLKEQTLIGKRCKICGKSLPWNSRYGICEACHFEMVTGDDLI